VAKIRPSGRRDGSPLHHCGERDHEMFSLGVQVGAELVNCWISGSQPRIPALILETTRTSGSSLMIGPRWSSDESFLKSPVARHHGRLKHSSVDVQSSARATTTDPASDQGGKKGLHTWLLVSGKEREWIGQAPMGKETASLASRERRLPPEAPKTGNLHS
jgi:hypothetical protein